MGAGNVWAMIVQLVSLPLVLKGLGSTAFGLWVLIQTFSANSGWLSLLDAGLVTAGTREIAIGESLGDRARSATTTVTLLIFLAAIGIVAGAVFGVLGVTVLPGLFGTPESLDHAFRVAAVFFGAQVVFDFLTNGLEGALEGVHRVDLSRVIDAVRRTGIAIATSIAALVTKNLATVSGWSLVASVVATITGSVLLAGRRLDWCGPTRAATRALFQYGKTVAFLRPIGVLHRTVDRMIVGIILGPQAVTLVEIATQIQGGADAFVSASSYAVMPSAAWLHAREDHGTLRQLLDRGTKYLLVLCIPLMLTIMVLAGPIVRVWVGPRYGDAAGLVAVALIYQVIVAPMAIGSNMLLGSGHAGDILRAVLAAIAINVGLSIVLVNHIGIVGAFIATIAGAVVSTPMLLRSILRRFATPLAEFVRSAIVPCLAPSLLAALGAAIGLLLGSRALIQLILGIAFAGLVAIPAALRWSVTRAELTAILRRRSPADEGIA